MKIIFLCGSLESGCDGVGDYTRRLAGALIKQGHEARIIALKDAFVSNLYDGSQNVDELDLPVLRLPANWSSHRRFDVVEKFVTAFNPSWISLQFVPFAFHSKGLPFGLSYYMAKISKGKKLHIMVHELWIGMEKKISKKKFIWSGIQKQLIYSMFRKLRPTLVNSQIQLYVEQIIKLGFEATLLPLFSNIPISNQSHKKPLSILDLSHEQKISFVVFGSVHPGAPIDEFSNEVFSYSKNKSIEISLIMVGRSSNEQKHWIKKWTSAGLYVDVRGEQSVQEISEILSIATIGISTNPITLVGKSGTVAAMCEHGLPVLCVSHPWIPRHKTALKPLPGISEYHPGKLESYLDGKIAHASFYNVCDIANSLAKSFQSLSNHSITPLT